MSRSEKSQKAKDYDQKQQRKITKYKKYQFYTFLIYSSRWIINPKIYDENLNKKLQKITNTGAKKIWRTCP